MSNDSQRTQKPSVIFNVPNTISWLRIISTAVIVLLMYLNWNWAAFVLFLIASISDYFDGYIARKTGAVTQLGKVLDQMSDKILITSVLICFVESGFVPGWLVVILVIRDTLVSIVRILASESGAIIAANMFGKIKTVSQMALTIGLYLELLDFSKSYMHLFNVIFIYIVAFSTILSGIIYMYQNRSYLDK
ncbi:MAG: CDP-diacylglycerol--glycerol-3-phosphate 3-phosphatidyltransferase [Thermotogaceae bacterium]|nr:CDP-diacylglycerol--glycerol-3-phosphate 3-phosphatidyltransferase [Thermotogaceae bacterium]